MVVSRWERWKKNRRKARKKAGKPPAAAYERFLGWLGYPATFLYVALGYAFVSTPHHRPCATVISHAFRLPLAWLKRCHVRRSAPV